MKTSEVNDSLIGKRCKCIFTGLMVTGTIEEVKITKHTAEVKVCFDVPHNWGGEFYSCSWSVARLCDGFGSLRYLQVIDEKYQAVLVFFSKPICDIDKDLAFNYSKWQKVNLKESIDSYETARFTQINEYSAVITSDKNMKNLQEWLSEHTPIETIQTLF